MAASEDQVDQVDTWRAEVKKLRRGIFGELTALFPEDRERVDAYFRPINERAEEAEETTIAEKK